MQDQLSPFWISRLDELGRHSDKLKLPWLFMALAILAVVSIAGYMVFLGYQEEGRRIDEPPVILLPKDQVYEELAPSEAKEPESALLYKQIDDPESVTTVEEEPIVPNAEEVSNASATTKAAPAQASARTIPERITIDGRIMVTPRPSGAWLVQLAAFGSERQLNAAWDNFSIAQANLAGALNRATDTSVANGKTIYRLQAGYFLSHDDAASWCSELKRRGVLCLVVENKKR